MCTANRATAQHAAVADVSISTVQWLSTHTCMADMCTYVQDVICCRLNWSKVKPRTKCRLESSFIPMRKSQHQSATAEQQADKSHARASMLHSPSPTKALPRSVVWHAAKPKFANRGSPAFDCPLASLYYSSPTKAQPRSVVQHPAKTAVTDEGSPALFVHLLHPTPPPPPITLPSLWTFLPTVKLWLQRTNTCFCMLGVTMKTASRSSVPLPAQCLVLGACSAGGVASRTPHTRSDRLCFWSL